MTRDVCVSHKSNGQGRNDSQYRHGHTSNDNQARSGQPASDNQSDNGHTSHDSQGRNGQTRNGSQGRDGQCADDSQRRNAELSVYEYVRDMIERGVSSPDEIAAAYLAHALRAPVRDREALLYGPVRQAVGAEFSSLSRAMRPGSGTLRGGSGSSSLTRQSHNNGWLWDPSTGDFVELGKATVGQFQASIDWHRKQIAGHQSTIAEYQRYIFAIEQAGVSCLDEIAVPAA